MWTERNDLLKMIVLGDEGMYGDGVGEAMGDMDTYVIS